MNKDDLTVRDLNFALRSARSGLSNCMKQLNSGIDMKEMQEATEEYQKLIQNMESTLSDRIALKKNKKRIKIIDDILNEEKSES